MNKRQEGLFLLAEASNERFRKAVIEVAEDSEEIQDGLIAFVEDSDVLVCMVAGVESPEQARRATKGKHKQDMIRAIMKQIKNDAFASELRSVCVEKDMSDWGSA